MKRIVALILALMMVLSLAACGTTQPTEPTEPSEPSDAPETAATAFKIGGTGPLTGGAAIYGNAAKNGAQIAVDEINALGGDIQFELRY